jgi:antitoxin component YwqK of YwqJK toxin-antitoxin module
MISFKILSNKLLFFIVFLTLFSCNSDNNSKNNSKNNTHKLEEKENLFDRISPECIKSLINCNEKEGVEFIWEPGFTHEIIKRKEFLKQIPENYTGYIKLCKEDKLYRYISCKNGKVDGLSHIYDCEGGYDEGYFKNFIAEGTWVHYNDMNEFDFVRNFKNGLLHGEYISYDKENLGIREKKNYFKGKLDGKSTRYFPNGNVEEYKVYDMGDEIITKTYYESGNLKSESNLQFSKTYYESGNLKSEFNLNNFKSVEYDEYGNILNKSVTRRLEVNRP